MSRLSRATYPAGALWPVRLVHFGAGAFHRSHQAWYTAHAGDGWGIAAVAPRSDTPLRQLGPQDGLYTLLTRDPDGDRAEVVASISRVLAASDPALADLVADPEVGVVTLTVTEAGYRPGSAVLDHLRRGLDRRAQRHGAPLAIVSCDNLADNGRLLHDGLAGGADAGLAGYLETSCAFPDTVVDRITPATTPDDIETVAGLIGLQDLAAVVAEPFSEWILEDTFPAGRPGWEAAGARFVTDAGPYARRKLRLLNAGHSMLAYLGGALGHRWVHEAVEDPVVHEALQDLWAEARTFLDGGGLEAYCAEIEERWRNRRLPHSLAQVATDGATKLQERTVPTVLAARAAGVLPVASARLLGAWVAYLGGASVLTPVDSRLDELRDAVTGPLDRAVRVALGVLDDRLADDADLCATVVTAAGDVQRRAQGVGGASR